MQPGKIFIAIGGINTKKIAVSGGEVLRGIDVLSDALLQLREGREERLVVELAIVKLTRPDTVPSIDGIQARVDRIERDLRDLRKADPSPPRTTGPADRPFASADQAVARLRRRSS